MPKISIITPVYNGEHILRIAIESIQSQTIEDFEILVVDDCSTDGTYDLLQRLAKQDSRIVSLQTPKNMRSSGARNVALRVARGEWTTLLDADDWYKKDRLEIMLAIAEEYQADVVLDNLQIYDHALDQVVDQTYFGNSNGLEFLQIDDFFDKDSPIRRGGAIGYSKPFFRTKFMRDHNILNWEKYRTCEDFLFLADLVLSGAKTVLIPQAYYVYRHQISPTTKKKSSTSHIEPAALQIVQASDELLDKYKNTLSNRAKQALLRRKNIFLTAHIADQQKEHIAQKRFWETFLLMVKYPRLIGYRMTGIINRLVKPYKNNP
jgi:glycosyltransferase involved in cell wall biosynthesis